MAKANKNVLQPAAYKKLTDVLKMRFQQNMKLHKGIEWQKVQTRLDERYTGRPDGMEKIWSLEQMEATGGEPDVIGFDKKTGEFIFYDCAAESPKGRRSICYDHDALNARKENKPANSAVQMAAELGISMLTEDQYRELQQLGSFDLKTSSWVVTPPAIRKLGGALFCDRRYNHVFLYHNGAESYYAARGFRGLLRL